MKSKHESKVMNQPKLKKLQKAKEREDLDEIENIGDRLNFESYEEVFNLLKAEDFMDRYKKA